MFQALLNALEGGLVILGCFLAQDTTSDEVNIVLGKGFTHPDNKVLDVMARQLVKPAVACLFQQLDLPNVDGRRRFSHGFDHVEAEHQHGFALEADDVGQLTIEVGRLAGVPDNMPMISRRPFRVAGPCVIESSCKILQANRKLPQGIVNLDHLVPAQDAGVVVPGRKPYSLDYERGDFAPQG